MIWEVFRLEIAYTILVFTSESRLMPGPEDIDRNVQRVIVQLNDAIGDMAGGTDLTGAIGELLRITLRHDTRITELESRVRELEQNQQR